MVSFIVFAVLAIATAVLAFIRIKKIVSTEMLEINFKDVFVKTLIYSGIFSLFFTAMLNKGMFWAEYPCDGLHLCKLIIGGYAFGFSLLTAIQLFIFYYWGKNIDDKWKKKLLAWFIIGFIVAILSLFLWLDGFAPYLEYPLANGLSFTNGLKLNNPRTGRPQIAWYALCILSGAILVYFMSDHFMYKEYGKHGILETTFYVAFPAGIIGARIWFCIGEGVPFADWYKIWQGGLTILGGATMGILFGVLWFIWRNPKYSIWVAIDCIVPTILIAQAVGRWGNFFNCEVHGLEASIDSFKWLPEIIRNNMTYSTELRFASPGMMFVPLFLIEGLVNIFGYFFIAHLIGKKCSKVLEPGDLGCAYIIWYGMTRVIMEPFRDASFNMGNGGYWSWLWSLIFVAGGTFAILVNHIVRYIIKKRRNTYIVQKGDVKLGLTESIIFGTIGIALFVVSAVLMLNNAFTEKIGFNPFNIGLILLTVGFSIIICAVPAIIRIFEARKKKVNA